MKGNGPRNAWLRMTDWMGLTEPGVKPARPSPRILRFGAVLWAASSLAWFVMAIQTQGEVRILSVVLVVLFLALAASNVVMLRQPGKATQNDRSHQDKSSAG